MGTAALLAVGPCICFITNLDKAVMLMGYPTEIILTGSG